MRQLSNIVETFTTDGIKPGLPLIFDELSLATFLGLSIKQMWFFIIKNNEQYATFYIDKDTREIVDEPDPARNLRTISAPKAGLKFAQSSLAYRLFKLLPMHEANFAYMRGKSIKHAAELQVDNEVLVKVDLKDFFGSHREGYVKSKLQEITGYNDRVCWLITKLCCKDGKLPQGSPASPVLSVVLNYQMDIELSKVPGCTYARYADDITFSGPDAHDNMYWKIIKATQYIVRPFKINWDKVHIMRTRAYSYWCGIDIPKVPGWICPPMAVKIRARSNGTWRITRVEPMDEATAEAIAQGLPYEKVLYYVQDIRRMLGLHLSDTVKVPRNNYDRLRREAMLAGLGYANEARFNGRVAYLRSIEPERALKITAIYEKYRRLRNGDSINGPQGNSREVSRRIDAGPEDLRMPA